MNKPFLGICLGFQLLFEYSKEFEGGINALDPNINIQWPLPVIGLSDRDKNLPLLAELINTKTI